MNDDVYSLRDRVALVTGGSRGIGLAVAERYLQLGASVVITGRDEESLKSATAALGDNAHYRVSDIDDLDKHEALLADIESQVGPLDILVNNAGRHCKKPALETTDEEFRSVLETNLVAVFGLSRAALSRMMPRGSGSIINISSMSAIFGLPGVVAYSSSKTGLLGLTRTLASECSASGVRINSIAPGFIETEMFAQAMQKDPARRDKILSRTPMNRLGSPDDIAHAAAFLASDAAAFITGVCLPVDGGNSIGF